MPLSEHEQRELEQIERYLAAEDPKFVSSIRNITPKARYKRRIVIGCIGFVLGVALLLAGVANAVPLSIAGFALMFLSMAWVVSSIMHMQSNARPRGDGEPPAPQDGESDQNVISLDQPKRQRSRKNKSRKSRGGSGSGFMDRIEARWLRRRDRPWY